MLINVNTDGTKSTVVLEGRLDTTTAPELETKLEGFIDSTTELVYDFKNLDYISSAGLRVVLLSQKKMNKLGSMKIINTKAEIKEIFDMTGFSDIINIE